MVGHRVEQVWRYPVKSMLGEQLEQVAVGDQGLSGDRRWAVVDAATGAVASAKQPRLWRRLLSASAALTGDDVRITLPGQGELAGSDPRTDGLLSELTGRAVRLSDRPQDGAGIDRADPEEVLERGVDAEVAAPELVLGQQVPGPTFLDYAPVHLISAGTLDRIGVAAERYRPNLVLSGGPEQQPFAENGWVGATLAVGGQVRLRVVLPTPRCAIPTLAHGALPRDPAALRVLMAGNRIDVPGFGVLPSVGVYALVERGGQVRQGDGVVFS